jgi:GGDEF domain-containing protein
MIDTAPKALVQTLIDSKEDMVVVFHNDDIILLNTAFKKFYDISAIEQYRRDFPDFTSHFVPHPSYFNQDNIAEDENWMDAILKLPELERVVSMMNYSFEPYAFSVSIDRSVKEYSIVTFSDITQSLIKRIMIENNANLDTASGAYTKEYFLQIAQSYEDAATFNEKVLGIILVSVESENSSEKLTDERALNTLIGHFKEVTRKDDMLVRWSTDRFLLIYFVDNEKNTKQMLAKLQDMLNQKDIRDLKCKFHLDMQSKDESISSLIKRIES